MRWASDLWFRVRAIFGRDAMQRDLEEEIAFHIEMEARKLRAAGMSPAEAKRSARLAFGGEDRFKESARESWGVGALTDLAGDLRYAARQLRKHPAFSTLAVITLALGIGGTVALFSVVYGVMLRPLPFEDEGRIVTWWQDYSWRGQEFDYITDYATAYESLAAYSSSSYTLRGETSTSFLMGTPSTVELFDVLGAHALLGRTFEPGEDRPGAEPVVILSHGLWQGEFGGDPAIIGRRISLDGTLTTVVGVMPRDFYFPTPAADVYVPLDMDPGDPMYESNGWLVLTGRLRDGITDAEVQENLDQITAALGQRYQYPEAWDKTRNAYVTPIREYLLGDVEPALLLLLSAVGVLLLMACANVSALILTKTADRTREMSVRSALGAGRLRVARQILTETVLLGIVAGVVGVALASGLFDLLTASLPIDPAFRRTLHLNWISLLAGLGLSVAVGSLIALAPIRKILRGDLAGASFSDRTGGTASSGGNRMQNVLVLAEVLLAVVLVTGASLLVRTVGQLRSLDLGLDPEGVLAVNVLLPEQETTPEDNRAFFTALLDRTRALPGVETAGLIARLPLRDGGWQGTIEIPDRPDLSGARKPNAMYRPVTPGTFDALGAHLVAGRGIEETDRADGPYVVVINESFARQIWGEENPVGRTFTDHLDHQAEVVGVVRDISLETMIGQQPMAVYYPWSQSLDGEGYGILLARTNGTAATLAAPLRDLIHELDVRAAIGSVQSMEDAVEAEMAEPLRLRFYLGLFSLLGLVMGTVGVYGVVSYSVHRRRTEFGVRMALGAQPRRLLGTVIRQGMLPVALGVLAGCGAALIATRALSGFLYEVEPTDAASFLAAAGTLLAVGIVAAAIPAIRAGSTDPAVALRSD
ncbi:MAG: ABC transporter permease [Gemmatimonadota bacterium]|jgi:predicted permease